MLFSSTKRYQKLIKLLVDTTNQPSKLRTRNWVEIIDESQGAYNDDDNNNADHNNSDIKFKTSMISSSLCDYSEAYIFVKGNITVPNTAAVTAVNNTNKE